MDKNSEQPLVIQRQEYRDCCRLRSWATSQKRFTQIKQRKQKPQQNQAEQRLTRNPTFFVKVTS